MRPARSLREGIQDFSANSQIVPYDEEDGDFKFTRGSKRTKIQPAPTVSEEPDPKPTTGNQSRVKQDEPQTEIKKTGRRKMSFSTPKDADSISQPKRGTRKSTRSSVGKAQHENASTNGTHVDEPDLDSMDLIGQSISQDRSELETKPHESKISLAFSDTPVINRNKELRRKTGGGRRSSLGMRGRRASSLIDNGHSAIPHHQVETDQFYKHIEAEGLSEPRRMKQLLTWCGERKLGSKPSHGTNDLEVVLTGMLQVSPPNDFTDSSQLVLSMKRF